MSETSDGFSKIDEYKTLKCPLKQLCKKTVDYEPLISAIDRTNKLIVLRYQFIRLFILYKYKNKEVIPAINKSFIIAVFKVLAKQTNRGAPQNKDTQTLSNDNLSH